MLGYEARSPIGWVDAPLRPPVHLRCRAYFCTRMANEWLGQRLDVLGAIIVFLAAILAIVNRANVSPSLAGGQAGAARRRGAGVVWERRLALAGMGWCWGEVCPCPCVSGPCVFIVWLFSAALAW